MTRNPFQDRHFACPTLNLPWDKKNSLKALYDGLQGPCPTVPPFGCGTWDRAVVPLSQSEWDKWDRWDKRGHPKSLPPPCPVNHLFPHAHLFFPF